MNKRVRPRLGAAGFRPRTTPSTPSTRRRGRDLLRAAGAGGAARLIGQGRVLEDSHPALEPLPDTIANDERPGRLDKVVFGVTAAIAFAFIAWGVVDRASMKTASTVALGWIMENMGWLFVLSATGFVVFIIWLAVGPYGRIPLGRDGEAPEFRTVSWIAMMFSAGMGIGLMFYGAAEPLAHFVTPPPGTAGGDRAAEAMATTMFHWALHPWSIYAVVGIAIAYSVFRKGRPLTISGVFEPLIGTRQTYGPAGKAIDIFAIFATLFGSASSLGVGALQIAEGARIVGWIDQVGNAFFIGIITFLTICFVISAVSGIEKGIQMLSNTNMVLAVALAFFVFVAGPTVFILNLLPTTLGTYLQDMMGMAARTGAQGDAANEWLAGWTVFYWAWWMSWTPFVGMFIARISRGRTIRQFVAGVLLVPSVVSLLWFSVFGGAAMHAEQTGAQLSQAGSEEATLFALLATLPWSQITSVLVMVLTSIFFVSGADAASIVMGTLSENGTIEPRRPTVIFWGTATGAVAIIMLLGGGTEALDGLQTIVIVAAGPFLFVMLAMMVALVRDLRSDPMVVRRSYARKAVNDAVVSGVLAYGDDFALAVEGTRPGAGVGPLAKPDEESADAPAKEGDQPPH